MGREPRRPDHPEQAVLLRQLRADLFAERDDADRTVLTAEAQQGVFRYIGTDNAVRTSTCSTSRGPTACRRRSIRSSPQQFQTVNGALGQGTTRATNLYQNTFRFINARLPNDNIYPTGRVDYQAASSLAVRGVLNLQ